MSKADKPDRTAKTGFDASPDVAAAPDKNGAALIADYVKRLPGKPGVYRMFDSAGTVLYVGKAKNLKKRVTSYTKTNRHPTRISRMIRATAAMEFVITESETEALLLEANYIKKLKPRYNILLRDDKSFPYILMRQSHPAAQLKKHRGARNIKGDYYGPFASAGAVNRTVDTLQRAFRLRTCSDSIYEARTRPCMLHQIKRCAAPCTGEISLEDYEQLANDATDFLRGKSKDLQERMTRDMGQAAKAQNYEKAGEIRDRLRAMARVTGGGSAINAGTFLEADIAAIHMGGGQSCVQVFFFRAGQNWGNRAFFPRHSKDATRGEVLDAFLAQFYADKPIPKHIFVNAELPNHDLLEKALSERADRRISILKPQRGEKKQILDSAEKNAEEALTRKLAEKASQDKLLTGLQEIFALPKKPGRIEVYDNSHIQGTNAIGAFIVAGPEGFIKREYRTFNIKDVSTEPGDDYAMMREVMRRRFSRLMKDDPSQASGKWPDLLLIDGGKGQLSSVMEALHEVGISDEISVVSIAKGPDRNAGRETFFMPGRDSFTLPPTAAVMYYLQRLRDEAHRFAIGTHRARRSKQMVKNPLDGIGGVGPRRKKALLAHFGSAKGVKGASVAELSQVEGVSDSLAQKVYGYFNA
ncbi:excinuclease ABC subunit UvrC [Robiginitomaculum antarcticum]|uniref:excinuclease ABC subunit UvrC n=1 Tax=Robiginitomaculum antarcticum TaxID=437507 RepID=UPI00036DC525|nr:excinuclease ABC subunit UvrC [Robiginitomaculum antarcticum]